MNDDRLHGSSPTGGFHSLSYRPSTQRWTLRHSEVLVLGEADPAEFTVHRPAGRGMGLRVCHALVGRALLEHDARPVHGGGVTLLWVPLLPSGSLLLAQDASGTPRLLPVAAPGCELPEALVRALLQLEVECAWALDEARSHGRLDAEVRRRLERARQQASLATLLCREALERADPAGARALWPDSEPCPDSEPRPDKPCPNSEPCPDRERLEQGRAAS